MLSKELNDTRPSHPRGYPVFRPRWDERPDNLLCCKFEREEELDWVRIAKHGDVVVAAYKIEVLGSSTYAISSLAVDEDYRLRGLGRWMLLHALGLIESKGGQIVYANWDRKLSLLQRVGFNRTSDARYRMNLERE